MGKDGGDEEGDAKADSSPVRGIRSCCSDDTLVYTPYTPPTQDFITKALLPIEQIDLTQEDFS